jgi:hypothetical protein
LVKAAAVAGAAAKVPAAAAKVPAAATKAKAKRTRYLISFPLIFLFLISGRIY